jgi:hypothetical protein
VVQSAQLELLELQVELDQQARRVYRDVLVKMDSRVYKESLDFKVLRGLVGLLDVQDHRVARVSQVQ